MDESDSDPGSYPIPPASVRLASFSSLTPPPPLTPRHSSYAPTPIVSAPSWVCSMKPARRDPSAAVDWAERKLSRGSSLHRTRGSWLWRLSASPPPSRRRTVWLLSSRTRLISGFVILLFIPVSVKIERYSRIMNFFIFFLILRYLFSDCLHKSFLCSSL